MPFQSHEVPVAYSMIQLAEDQRNRRQFEPFQQFLCYWSAFNNIYTTLAEQKKRAPKLKTYADGTIRTKAIFGLEMPVIQGIGEREQIDLAFTEFNDSLKSQLVLHESTKYFVYRIPRWRGSRIEFDEPGQRLNGVLNVGHTLCEEHPVWSPINTKKYEQFIAGDRDTLSENDLAKQILYVLYTIRNNLFHGGKRADDANDLETVKHAVPLIEIIVHHFVEVPSKRFK